MSDSKRTTLDEFKRDGKHFRLVHATAGIEAAGAGTRPTKEKWGALVTLRDGTNHGQWKLTEVEARELFNKWRNV